MIFYLSRLGIAQLGLFYSDGITPIDTLTYGAQAENVSYGRSRDGAGSWSYFAHPSPGLRNDYAVNPSVKEYFITCDPDSFAYIYKNYSEDNFIPITFSHGSRLWTDVRMRIRGDTSRSYPKKSSITYHA